MERKTRFLNKINEDLDKKQKILDEKSNEEDKKEDKKDDEKENNKEKKSEGKKSESGNKISEEKK